MDTAAFPVSYKDASKLIKVFIAGLNLNTERLAN